jgi:hypothetical protein
MEAHLHGKHPHPKCPKKRKKRNNTEPKGTLKIFMPSKRQQKPWGRVNLVGKLEGDQGMHS